MIRPGQFARVLETVELVEGLQQHGCRSGKGAVLVIAISLRLRRDAVVPQAVDLSTVALQELNVRVSDWLLLLYYWQRLHGKAVRES